MTGIFFTPPNTDAVPPADPPSADVVGAGGWWPDINITDVRDAVKLDTTVSPAKIRDSIRNAILEVSRELDAWRIAQEAAGHLTLAAVPGRQVDGISEFVLRWNRAINSVVGADLGERLVGTNVTSAGLERVDALRTDIDIYQRNVRHAVRDFLNLPRIRARMI